MCQRPCPGRNKRSSSLLQRRRGSLGTRSRRGRGWRARRHSRVMWKPGGLDQGTCEKPLRVPVSIGGRCARLPYSMLLLASGSAPSTRTSSLRARRRRAPPRPPAARASRHGWTRAGARHRRGSRARTSRGRCRASISSAASACSRVLLFAAHRPWPRQLASPGSSSRSPSPATTPPSRATRPSPSPPRRIGWPASSPASLERTVGPELEDVRLSVRCADRSSAVITSPGAGSRFTRNEECNAHAVPTHRQGAHFAMSPPLADGHGHECATRSEPRSSGRPADGQSLNTTGAIGLLHGRGGNDTAHGHMSICAHRVDSKAAL